MNNSLLVRVLSPLTKRYHTIADPPISRLFATEEGQRPLLCKNLMIRFEPTLLLQSRNKYLYYYYYYYYYYYSTTSRWEKLITNFTHTSQIDRVDVSTHVLGSSSELILLEHCLVII